MEFRPRTTNPSASFDSNRFQSYATRHQQARAAIRDDGVRETGVLADWRTVVSRRNSVMTPIERFHWDANLLRPKSGLAQLITTQKTTTFQVAPSPVVAPTQVPETKMEAFEQRVERSRVFDDATAQRLNKQYRQYEQSGVDFFKEKNWVRARDCFDICRSLDRDNPWPHAIDTLVALETTDVSRAVNSLMGAVARTQSLTEIKLDINQLYGSRLEFEKSIDKANLMASQDESGKPHLGHLLLSYCAWLNGDLATAASAAQTAARSMPEELQENMKRYADLLKDLASRPGNPAT